MEAGSSKCANVYENHDLLGSLVVLLSVNSGLPLLQFGNLHQRATVIWQQQMYTYRSSNLPSRLYIDVEARVSQPGPIMQTCIWQVRVGADGGNAGKGNVEHQTFDVANQGKLSHPDPFLLCSNLNVRCR